MVDGDIGSPSSQWLVPRFPVPLPVTAFMTTRAGGVSRGGWTAQDGSPGLNVGLGCGDDPRSVLENRRRVAAAVESPVLWLDQVHGVTVVDGDRDLPGGIEADAAFTTRSDLALAVMAADCLPILVTDREATIIGVAHGGWRGLSAGIAGHLVSAMRERRPGGDLMAWLGPRIGPAAFEVGAEVRDAFVARSGALAEAFAPAACPDRWLADLAAIARVDLTEAGVIGIVDSALCTVADPQRFWSHRRDRPGGRMAAVIRRPRRPGVV